MWGMISYRIARHLATWGYELGSPEFGKNFLSGRVERARDEDEEFFAFGSLCAVPVRPRGDVYEDFSAFAGWLQPQNLIHYDPGGVWLPVSTRTFVSAGLILAEDDYNLNVHPRLWQQYILAGRDGYFEFGRRVGRRFREYTIYPFAPMTAWIQQFTSLLQEARAKQALETEYVVVLNLPHLRKAALVGLGDGWPDYFRWPGDPVPTPIESAVQLDLVIGEKTPQEVGRWFAERIDNVFGFNEQWPRCYNHPNTKGSNGPPGALPTNRLSYG